MPAEISYLFNCQTPVSVMVDKVKRILTEYGRFGGVKYRARLHTDMF